MKKLKWLTISLLVTLFISTASPISSFAEQVSNPADQTTAGDGTTVDAGITTDNGQSVGVDAVTDIQFKLDNPSYSAKDFKATVIFPDNVDFDMISTNSIHVRNKDLGDDQSADVAIRLKTDAATHSVTITLKEDLDQDTYYQIIADEIYDLKGNILDEATKSFRSGAQQDEVVTDLNPITNLKGTAISPTSIKFTWSYDKNDEKNIDGFYVYDDEGNLLTEDNDVNAKDREFILKGLKPDKSYSISVSAFKLVDDESSDDLESDQVSAEAKTQKLKMPNFSESSLIANVKGNDIQYYWSYKNYQDYSENFTDYEIQIADNSKFTKNVKKIALAKGNYLQKNAIKQRSTKNNQKITKYFRIVNKAFDIASAPTKKTIIVRKAVSPKAPKLVVGDVQDNYVTVQITDYSTNEKAFNLYYVDINGNKTLYTTIKSKDSKGTGDVTSVDVYWLYKGDFHGFIATAVDQYGLEGKASSRVIVSEPATDNTDTTEE